MFGWRRALGGHLSPARGLGGANELCPWGGSNGSGHFTRRPLETEKQRGGGLGRLETLGTYMAVSENRGTPKLSILIGVSIINHPFSGTTIFGNTHIKGYLKRRGEGWIP